MLLELVLLGPEFNSISPEININNKVKLRTVTAILLEGESPERENFVVYLTSHSASNTAIFARHCRKLAEISMN